MNRIDRETEEAVRRFLSLIAERFDIAGAIVYGSRARGTHRPESDADVAVLLKGEHQRFLKPRWRCLISLLTCYWRQMSTFRRYPYGSTNGNIRKTTRIRLCFKTSLGRA